MATEIIYSEITGTVWKIQSQLGDLQEPDASIMILESMKMEIPMLVEFAGTVAAIHVQEGDVVQEGDIVVEIA